MVLTLGCPGLLDLLVPTDPNQTTDPNDTMTRPQATFSTSLHGTRPGKATFYNASDGFGTVTNVNCDTLPCANCHGATYADGTAIGEDHTPGCADCHADPEAPTGDVADSVCLSCHGRQGAEQNVGLGDVHRNAGMGCMDCHTAREMHGDGTVYASFLEDGAMDVE